MDYLRTGELNSYNLDSYAIKKLKEDLDYFQLPFNNFKIYTNFSFDNIGPNITLNGNTLINNSAVYGNAWSP